VCKLRKDVGNDFCLVVDVRFENGRKEGKKRKNEGKEWLLLTV